MASMEAIAKPRSRGPASVLDQNVPDGTKEEVNSDSSVSPYSKFFKNPKKDSDKLIDDLKKL